MAHHLVIPILSKISGIAVGLLGKSVGPYSEVIIFLAVDDYTGPITISESPRTERPYLVAWQLSDRITDFFQHFSIQATGRCETSSHDDIDP